ncbi:nitroreductase family protein [Kribbella orskensis]|uniref:Nitroreductase family protein n=1 Tax=Kribbella orskensis TaxID=2512216 RepID=A0ABY2B8S0_9ACTN|nr:MULTISPECIES: nitroreductase family protein [Kribbella]TCN31144.1 nitroreductase family protein [Kribbella sp. VKM Ac-2500]TCO11650.1 nitroreductase family protein [Kribbella orskensis]
MSTAAPLTDDEVGILLTAAVHAPSMDNTQPWRFEVAGPVIDVRLDEERLLPAADPAGRAMRIGLGAAAFNLRVAAAMLGHESAFTIAPDPADPAVVARIFLSERNGPVPGLSALYGEITRRHTYRGPMVEQAIPPIVVGALTGAAEAEGAVLHWLDEDAKRQLAQVLREADDLDLHDEDRLHERAEWIGGKRPDDGVPDTALGPVPTRPAMVRDLSAGFVTPGRDQAAFEEHPVIAVLSTEDEDEHAWVRAGLALQRVLLTATSSVLAVSFLNQALEYPALRGQIRQLVGGHAWPQMILRIGYPTEAEAGTGRLPWRDTLDRWF